MSPVPAHVLDHLKRLEQRARESLDRIVLPPRLPQAFRCRVTRLRGALDFATKADVKRMSQRIEQLHEKMDHFVKAARQAAPSK
jgi:hypothetical protein